MRSTLLLSWLWLALLWSVRAETIPPTPAAYFNDAAGIVSHQTAQGLDEKLRQFERDTSNQILVVIYKKMDSSSSVQDYTVRVAESWKVGQAHRNNGAVLFVFTESHQMYIQVGYGLEGALPDILCKQIIENEIKPRFRAGDFDTGLSAGVDAILKATRGEYHGTGQVHGGDNFFDQHGALIILIIFVTVFIFISIRSAGRGKVYSGRGGSSSGGYWGGGFSGGGFGGGGGSSGDGGGGFSGGGGSFGGGGAGGSW